MTNNRRCVKRNGVNKGALNTHTSVLLPQLSFPLFEDAHNK